MPWSSSPSIPTTAYIKANGVTLDPTVTTQIVPEPVKYPSVQTYPGITIEASCYIYSYEENTNPNSRNSDSAVNITEFIINNVPPIPVPYFVEPAPSTFFGSVTIAVLDATAGSTIVITTDGSTPTHTNGTIYTAPLTFTATTTLKAFAYKTGLLDSLVNTGVYTLGIITPPAGSGQVNVADNQSFAFEIRTKSWDTVWHNQPDRAAIRVQSLLQAGIYAINSQGVFLMLNGVTDNDVAIPFAWKSGAQVQPTENREKDVRRVTASVAFNDPPPYLTVQVFRNGNTDADAQNTFLPDNSPVEPGMVKWSPRPLSRMTTWQVGIEGTAQNGGEVISLAVDVVTKGQR